MADAGKVISTNYAVQVSVDGINQITQLYDALAMVRDLAKAKTTHAIKVRFDVEDPKNIANLVSKARVTVTGGGGGTTGLSKEAVDAIVNAIRGIKFTGNGPSSSPTNPGNDPGAKTLEQLSADNEQRKQNSKRSVKASQRQADAEERAATATEARAQAIIAQSDAETKTTASRTRRRTAEEQASRRKGAEEVTYGTTSAEARLLAQMRQKVVTAKKDAIETELADVRKRITTAKTTAQEARAAAERMNNELRAAQRAEQESLAGQRRELAAAKREGRQVNREKAAILGLDPRVFRYANEPGSTKAKQAQTQIDAAMAKLKSRGDTGKIEDIDALHGALKKLNALDARSREALNRALNALEVLGVRGAADPYATVGGSRKRRPQRDDEDDSAGLIDAARRRKHREAAEGSGTVSPGYSGIGKLGRGESMVDRPRVPRVVTYGYDELVGGGADPRYIPEALRAGIKDRIAEFKRLVKTASIAEGESSPEADAVDRATARALLERQAKSKRGKAKERLQAEARAIYPIPEDTQKTASSKISKAADKFEQAGQSAGKLAAASDELTGRMATLESQIEIVVNKIEQETLTPLQNIARTMERMLEKFGGIPAAPSKAEEPVPTGVPGSYDAFFAQQAAVGRSRTQRTQQRKGAVDPAILLAQARARILQRPGGATAAAQAEADYASKIFHPVSLPKISGTLDDLTDLIVSDFVTQNQMPLSPTVKTKKQASAAVAGAGAYEGGISSFVRGLLGTIKSRFMDRTLLTPKTIEDMTARRQRSIDTYLTRNKGKTEADWLKTAEGQRIDTALKAATGDQAAKATQREAFLKKMEEYESSIVKFFNDLDARMQGAGPEKKKQLEREGFAFLEKLAGKGFAGKGRQAVTEMFGQGLGDVQISFRNFKNLVLHALQAVPEMPGGEWSTFTHPGSVKGGPDALLRGPQGAKATELRELQNKITAATQERDAAEKELQTRMNLLRSGTTSYLKRYPSKVEADYIQTKEGRARFTAVTEGKKLLDTSRATLAELTASLQGENVKGYATTDKYATNATALESGRQAEHVLSGAEKLIELLRLRQKNMSDVNQPYLMAYRKLQEVTGGKIPAVAGISDRGELRGGITSIWQQLNRTADKDVMRANESKYREFTQASKPAQEYEALLTNWLTAMQSGDENAMNRAISNMRAKGVKVTNVTPNATITKRLQDLLATAKAAEAKAIVTYLRMASKQIASGAPGIQTSLDASLEAERKLLSGNKPLAKMLAAWGGLTRPDTGTAVGSVYDAAQFNVDEAILRTIPEPVALARDQLSYQRLQGEVPRVRKALNPQELLNLWNYYLSIDAAVRDPNKARFEQIMKITGTTDPARIKKIAGSFRNITQEGLTTRSINEPEMMSPEFIKAFGRLEPRSMFATREMLNTLFGNLWQESGGRAGGATPGMLNAFSGMLELVYGYDPRKTTAPGNAGKLGVAGKIPEALLPQHARFIQSLQAGGAGDLQRSMEAATGAAPGSAAAAAAGATVVFNVSKQANKQLLDLSKISLAKLANEMVKLADATAKFADNLNRMGGLAGQFNEGGAAGRRFLEDMMASKRLDLKNREEIRRIVRARADEASANAKGPAESSKEKQTARQVAQTTIDNNRAANEKSVAKERVRLRQEDRKKREEEAAARQTAMRELRGARSLAGENQAIEVLSMLNRSTGLGATLGAPGVSIFGSHQEKQVERIVARTLSTLSAQSARLRGLQSRGAVLQGLNLDTGANLQQQGATAVDMLASFQQVANLVDGMVQANLKFATPKLRKLNAVWNAAGDKGAAIRTDLGSLWTAEEAYQNETGSNRERLRKRFRRMQDRYMRDYGVKDRGKLEETMIGEYDHYANVQTRISKSMADQLGTQLDLIQGAKKQRTIASDFLNAVQRLSYYTGAAFIVYNIAAGFRQALASAVELESQMVRISGILGATDRRMVGWLSETAVENAKKFAVSIRDSANALQVFSQAGFSGQDLVRVSQAALAAQQGAGLTAEQAQELLIAVSRTPGVDVGSTEILDRISRIERRYAVSGQDLAVAIQRAGPFAAQRQPGTLGGIDAMDFIIGATTAIVEKTRVSGNQAATALRFMLSRMAAPEVGRRLQSYGVNLGGSTPEEMRAAPDIFADIAGRYKALRDSGNTTQAAELLTTVAGARQVGVAAALFSDWDRVMTIMNESSMAYGDNARRTALQLDTLAAQIEKTKVSFAAFGNAFVQESGLGWLTRKLVLPGMQHGLNFGATYPAGMLAAVLGLSSMGLKRIGSQAEAMELAARGDPAQARALLAKSTVIRRLTDLGSVAAVTALPDTKALEGAQKAANVMGAFGRFGSILGGLTSIAVFTAGLEAAAWVAKSIYEWKTRFTIHAPDMAAIQGSEHGQRLAAQASALNLMPAQLMEIVRNAALTARTTTSNQLGSGIFIRGENGRVREDPRAYGTFQRAYLDVMMQNIPALRDMTDETERTALAMELLRDVIQQMAAPGQSVLTELNASIEEQLTKDMKRIEDSMKSNTFGIGVSPNSVLGRFINTTVEYNGRQAPLQTFFGSGRGIAGGVAPAEAEARAIGIFGNERNKAALRRSVEDELNRIYQPQLMRIGRNFDGTPRTGAGAAISREYADAVRGAYAKLAMVVNAPMRMYTQIMESMALSGMRPSMEAAFTTRLGARAAFRDRILEVLLRGYEESARVEGTARSFARAGITYDVIGQRAQSSAGVLQSLQGIQAAIQADLIRNESQLVVQRLQRHAVGDLIMQEGEGGTWADFAIPEADRAVLRQRLNTQENREAYLRLEAQRALIQQQFEIVKRNEELFSELSPATQAVIRGFLRLDTESQNMELSLGTINDALIETARVQETVRARFEQQVQSITFSGRMEQLRYQQGVEIVQLQSEYLASLAELQGGRGAGYTARFTGTSQQFSLRIAAVMAQFENTMRSINARPEYQNLETGEKTSSNKRRLEEEAARQQRDEDLARVRGEQMSALMRLEQQILLDMQRTVIESSRTAAQEALSGLRSALSSYEAMQAAFRGQFQSIIAPLANTFGSRIANTFLDALVGPQGMFGKQFESLFSTTAQLQANMIYEAHIRGIRDGFNLVKNQADFGPMVGSKYRPGPIGRAVVADKRLAGPVGSYAQTDLPVEEGDIEAQMRQLRSRGNQTLFSDTHNVAYRTGTPGGRVPSNKWATARAFVRDNERGTNMGIDWVTLMEYNSRQTPENRILTGVIGSQIPSYARDNYTNIRNPQEFYNQNIRGLRSMWQQSEFANKPLGTGVGVGNLTPDQIDRIMRDRYNRSGADTMPTAEGAALLFDVNWNHGAGTARRMRAEVGDDNNLTGMVDWIEAHTSQTYKDRFAAQWERRQRVRRTMAQRQGLSLPAAPQMATSWQHTGLRGYGAYVGGSYGLATPAFGGALGFTPGGGDGYPGYISRYAAGRYVLSVRRSGLGFTSATGIPSIDIMPQMATSWQRTGLRPYGVLATGYYRPYVAGRYGLNVSRSRLRFTGESYPGYIRPFTAGRYDTALNALTFMGGGLGFNTATLPDVIKNLPSMKPTSATGRLWSRLFGTKNPRLAALRDSGLAMVGSLGGGWLGDAIGGHRGSNYASEFAGIGSGVGMLFGPLGGLAGGLIGGIVGGLFGKKREKPATQALEKIERNTREAVQAINNQSQMLSLDNRLLNVPASFVVPGYRPMSVGAGGTVNNNQTFTITVNEATDAQATANEVMRQISQNMRASGTYVSARY